MGSCKEWMKELNESIGHKPIKDLVIPGSHDAATWDLVSNIGDAFAKCQRVDIKQQLLCGSRYLDLRAQYRDNDWYMFHGIVAMKTKLVEVINDLKWFAENYPEEVVIVTLLGPDICQIDAIIQRLEQHTVSIDDEAELGKSISNFCLNDFYKLNKNIVLLDFEGRLIDLKKISVGASRMDRGGIYYDFAVWTPEDGNNYFNKQYEQIDKNKMWIYHLNVPFTTTVMAERPDWVEHIINPNGNFFDEAAAHVQLASYKALDLFTGIEVRSKVMKNHFGKIIEKISKKKRLNIINIDYIDEFNWIDFIINLNNLK